MAEEMTAIDFVKSIMPVQLDSTIQVPEGISLRKVHEILTDMGYSAPMNQHFRAIFVYDYLPPATRDSDGFFIEDDALAARIRRELRQEPYNRQDDSIFPRLLSNEQRGDNEDVIGLIPGSKTQYGYHSGYMYLPSKVLWYSNLEHCIREVIPDFDTESSGSGL